METQRSKRFLGIPDEFWIGFILMVGFFLKLVYDINAGYQDPTLDAGVWMEIKDGVPNSGHIGVMQYYFTSLRLPDFDLTRYSQFTRPPLFYWISVLILEILHRMMGWAIGTSLHLLQCINVIYVAAGTAFGFGMVHRFGIRGRKMTVTILFLTMFPAYYNLGASLTPDALAFLFSMYAMNRTLVWYGTRRSKDFYKVGLALGLGLMCSFSVILVLPAVLILHYDAGKDGRRNETPLGRQLLIFCLIAGIMGAAWPIFRLVYYHVPFFYSEAAKAGGSSLKAYPILSRIGLPNREIFRRLNTIGEGRYEYNIWGQIFKTALVGFKAANTGLRMTRRIAVFTLYLGIVLCILMHIMWIYTLLSSKTEIARKHFLVVGYLSMLAGFLFISLRYPHIYVMDFKMIAPIVIFPVIGSGLCGRGRGGDNLFERITTWMANGLTLIYAILTAFLFGFYF